MCCPQRILFFKFLINITLNLGGERRHIIEWDTFLCLGFDISDVKHISDKDLHAYPIGPAVIDCHDPGSIMH